MIILPDAHIIKAVDGSHRGRDIQWTSLFSLTANINNKKKQLVFGLHGGGTGDVDSNR